MNLNKANFFDEAFEKYPDAAKKFHTWIDNYKKEIGWNKLFGNTIRIDIRDFIDAARAPKFHELPFDMQKGIILRFLCETYPESHTTYIDVDKFKTIFSNALAVIEIMPDL